MGRLRIRNHGKIQAELRVQGSKNSSLPCLAAALLHSGTTVLDGVPMIEDVRTAIGILRALGAQVTVEGSRVTVCAHEITCTEIPPGFMRKMRSSVIFLGAMLARTGEAKAVYPGGCVLGSRPIDFHLEGFRRLGCEVNLREEIIEVRSCGMSGAVIRLPFSSVGATENLLLAAAGAQGTTVIENAAREPEIVELSRLLMRMGFDVRGAGTSRIAICGRAAVRDVCFSMSGDRIVAGTWLLCCMNAGGTICLERAPVQWMQSTLEVLGKMGAVIRTEGMVVECSAPERILPVSYLETAPYPGFPTDMQSQFLPVLSGAQGDSCICETVFSSRFRIVSELERMGADIEVSDDLARARIRGGKRLHGTAVTAPDLRGGAALIIAAMGAEGDTVIDDFYHIERGYECIADTIRLLGGDACWIV
ncbi:MAG: UDP-N-acetylglucosamine 1-carboxyvinyltransferase [Lachnospiraceae bacterium]|nr:UDP-N-acetylglucosamine 1-carboxyvinyltransferase [Lachnospiraceae bacterium]